MRLPDPAAPRALMVCDHFVRYQTGLAEGLVANGWQPILLGRDHDLAFGGEEGAMRHYVQMRLGTEQPFVQLEGRVRDQSGWAAVPRVRRRLRYTAPTVTHVQTCISNDPRLALAAGLRPRRYAITVHDVDQHPGDADWLIHHRLMTNALIRWAGLVFVHADRLRDGLLARGFTGAPIVVVPHGVDKPEPRPLPSEPTLLFFGRLSRYKGLSVLLDSLPLLWRSTPAATLTIAGEGTLPHHPALDDARVRVMHRHIAEEEVPGLFAAASLVILPYVEASQSGVGSLAKGYGRPLVASAVGGLPELLSDGSGVLIPPSDPDALAAAIAGLLADRDRLEALGAAALRSVDERSGWPVVGRLVTEAYTRYLGSR